MARIRSIHPGLWTDPEYCGLSADTLLFGIGVWGEADDYGVVEWKPARLKMRLAPLKDLDPEVLLTELVAAGMLVRIERDGKTFGVVRNFRQWQKPRHPSEPIIPLDPEILQIIKLDPSRLPPDVPLRGAVPNATARERSAVDRTLERRGGERSGREGTGGKRESGGVGRGVGGGPGGTSERGGPRLVGSGRPPMAEDDEYESPF